MVSDIKRYDIVLVKLNPILTNKFQKTSICIVISPNEMNILKTILIVPITTKGLKFIFRPEIKFDNKDGLILLDQIKNIDKSMIIEKVGVVDKNKSREISKILVEIFEF